MAEAIQVNAPYLRKVINKLAQAGIVESQRGKGGGLRLLIAPDKLTLLAVINATNPIQRIISCPLGQKDHLELCPLHSELDEAIAHIIKLLANRTIGELLATRKKPSQCSFSKCDDLYQL